MDSVDSSPLGRSTGEVEKVACRQGFLLLVTMIGALPPLTVAFGYLTDPDPMLILVFLVFVFVGSPISIILLVIAMFMEKRTSRIGVNAMLLAVNAFLFAVTATGLVSGRKERDAIMRESGEVTQGGFRLVARDARFTMVCETGAAVLITSGSSVR